MLEGMQSGKNFLIFTKTDKGEWKPIGGQRGATLNMSAETIDRTTKESGQWREKHTTFKEWSIDGDGLIIFDYDGYLYLRKCFIDSKKVDIAISHTNLAKEEVMTNFIKGKAIITDFTHELGYEEDATYSITLEGASQLCFDATLDVPKTSGISVGEDICKAPEKKLEE